VIPWSPIARGILAKPIGASSLRSETDGFLKLLFSNEMKESEKTIVNRVEEIAKKRGVSMAQVATAWVLSKEGRSFLDPNWDWSWRVAVTAPIVGLNSEERIKDMVAAVNLELTEDEKKYLEEPYVPRPIAGHS
jgi:versiconal hemiacetal acetate reductase